MKMSRVVVVVVLIWCVYTSMVYGDGEQIMQSSNEVIQIWDQSNEPVSNNSDVYIPEK